MTTVATPSDSTVIWRYFDFAKFVSLLDRRALFFASAANLAAEDPFEGSLPRANAGEPPSRPSERQWMRDLILVSSWHINSDESLAMWRLYSRSAEAIAIRTTVGRLRSCTRGNEPDPVEVRIGKVEYIDYRQYQLPEPDYLGPYFCKAKPYAYENEVRAVIDLYAFRNEKDRPLIRQVLADGGRYVPVDLDILLEEIYVSPMAGGWFLDLVKTILVKFHQAREPRQSVLRDPPVFC